MPLLIISLLIQAAFIVHVIKTGRNTLWIWILIIPYLAIPGIIAYLIIEVLPELTRSRGAQRTARGLRRAIDPGRELRRYESEAQIAGNVANRQRYAEELVRHGRYDDAIAQYRGELLPGVYDDWLAELRPSLDRQCTELCDLLAEAGAHLLSHHACHHVVAAAGRVGDDEGDGAGRVVLRDRGRCRASECDQHCADFGTRRCHTLLPPPQRGGEEPAAAPGPQREAYVR